MSKEKVHFVGIGGIGVSALARWYKSEGWEVSGSDPAASSVTNELKKDGIKIIIGGHRASSVPDDVKKLIYSVAVVPENAERAKARKLVIPELSYPQALGELTKKYRTITVSGAHGKSTTTAMAALMLVRAGFDPTVIMGTKLKEFGGSNFRRGRSNWLLIEADEYRAAFLNYHPEIAIITNIDREHLDFYKNLGRIRTAFSQFVKKIQKRGTFIANGDEKEVMRLAKKSRVLVLSYSTRSKRAEKLQKILKVPGRHNLSNAMAVDTLGERLSIPMKVRAAALASFRGVWRRFEYKGMVGPAKLFDDYAHHPTEIKATLEGAREMFPKSRIIAIFKPHHAERLTALFVEFSKAFSDADEVIILETYRVAGREKDETKNMKTAEELARALQKRGMDASYFSDYKRAMRSLKPKLKRGDAIVLMTAEAR